MFQVVRTEPPRQVRTVIAAPESVVAAACYSVHAGSERILVCGVDSLSDIHRRMREFEQSVAGDGWKPLVRTGRSVRLRKGDADVFVRFLHHIDRDEPFAPDTVVTCLFAYRMIKGDV